MRRPGLSLQSRFYAAILALLAIVVLVMVLLWQRQQDSQHEVSEVTRHAMHGLLSEQVRIDGEAEVRQLADALANPLYYFDLDAVGALARAALREADVDYVLVYDAQGRILHDGSGDIAAFGQPMNDPLAKQVIAATGFLMRFIAIGEGWRDQPANRKRCTTGEFRGQQHVDMQRHVMPVLLHRADGDENRGLAPFDGTVVIGPGEFRGEGSGKGHGEPWVKWVFRASLRRSAPATKIDSRNASIGGANPWRG